MTSDERLEVIREFWNRERIGSDFTPDQIEEQKWLLTLVDEAQGQYREYESAIKQILEAGLEKVRELETENTALTALLTKARSGLNWSLIGNGSVWSGSDLQDLVAEIDEGLK